MGNEEWTKAAIHENKKSFAVREIFFAVLFILILSASCTGKESPAGELSGTDTEEAVIGGPAWPVAALLKSGVNPLWFELGPDGPVHIESPGAAALTPFIPWPHARYITGFHIWNDFLVMPVNTDGFLIAGSNTYWYTAQAADIALYRVSGGGLWAPYTAESLFFLDGRPAVLLYRSGFFAELAAASPSPQVFVLDDYKAAPVPARVPALESYPPGGPWEAEAIRRRGGFWYYRMKEKGKEQNETAYFRTADLSKEGEEISSREWMESGMPEIPDDSLSRLAAVLNRAVEANSSSAAAILTVSPDFEGPRIFAAQGQIDQIGSAENLIMLYGYCRDAPDSIALALFPDGRGFYSTGNHSEVRRAQASVEAAPFSLPALPEGFVYTGIALLGDVVFASWEETQLPAVGAAGFMAVAVEWR